jgi:hypothetical protein
VADTKISGLTAAAAALAADELAVNEAGTSKKVTLAQIGAVVSTLGSYSPGSFTVLTGGFAHLVKRLILTGTQRATLEGDAQLRID